MMELITLCVECFAKDGGVFRGKTVCPDCGGAVKEIGFIETKEQ